MQWTEERFLTFVEKEIGLAEAKLIKDLIATLRTNNKFSTRCGEGKKFPSLRIYAENLSRHKQIIGIETYKLFTREPRLHVWVNLAPHEESHSQLITKIRDFLGEPQKKFPYLAGEDPLELIGKVNLILALVSSNS